MSFNQNKLKGIVSYNRKSLNVINTWITRETLKSSIYNYGIPENLVEKINKDIGEECIISSS